MVCNDGTEFYAELERPFIYDKWVEENVVPHLNSVPLKKKDVAQHMKLWLQSKEPFIIYCDWPSDFMHLTNLMQGGDFTQSYSLDMSMTLLHPGIYHSDIPHHALEDAIGLKKWHEEQLKKILEI